MTWKTILTSLGITPGNVLLENQSGQDYMTFIWLHPNTEVAGITTHHQFNETILYLCYASEWDSFSFPPNCSFILLLDTPTAPDFSAARNVAVVHTRENFRHALQQLISDFGLETRMKNHILRLYAMVANGKPLQALIDEISTIYCNYVSLIDSGYTILAYSDKYAAPIQPMTTEQTCGHLSYAAISLLQKGGYMTPTAKRTSPITIFFHEGTERMARCNMCIIYVNNVSAASISIFDTYNTIPPVKLYYLEQIASVLSVALQKNDFYTLNKANYFTHLMSILIGRDTFDPDIMEYRLQAAGYKLNPYKYIIFVDTTGEIDSSFPYNNTQALGTRLASLFSNSIFSVGKNSIIFLCTTTQREMLSREKCKDWVEFLKTSHLQVGISKPYGNLNETTKALQEARLALSVGAKLDPRKLFYLFDDYTSYVAAKTLCDNSDYKMFLYAPLMQLLDYDRENNTTLTDTLITYSENPKSIKDVCQKLYIHKNTLYYRLEKIRKIMGTDPDDIEEINKINMTLWILRYQGLLQK